VKLRINVKKWMVVIVLALMMPHTHAYANPFSDVPAGHWAYDALTVLASRGIVSGTADDVFDGSRPTTRYEIAAFLVRVLADADMNKANRSDIAMLDRLLLEFHEEMVILGARFEGPFSRFANMEPRLGGWILSGLLRMDMSFLRHGHWYDGVPSYTANLSVARLNFERHFGEDNSMHFVGRLQSFGGGSVTAMDRFFVTFPIFYDTSMTVGRFAWNWEQPYYFYTGGITDLSSAGPWLTDTIEDGIGFRRSFALGSFQLMASRAHEDSEFGSVHRIGYDAWRTAAVGNFQFTEQLGLDLGVVSYLGDDASINTRTTLDEQTQHQRRLSSLNTLFGGIRFDFNDHIGLRGIYYGQRARGGGERWRSYDNVANTWGAWDRAGDRWSERARAYRIMLNIGQELLGFTSLWVGYDYMDWNFIASAGWSGEIMENYWFTSLIGADVSTWRIGATQQWSNQWRTWAYFARHNFDINPASLWSGSGDFDVNVWGLGVEYRLNSNVAFALNYINRSFGNIEDVNLGLNNHTLRFRTEVEF